MTVNYVDLGLRFRRAHSTSISPEGTTGHYAGGVQWPGADLSSPEAFRDSTDHARCPSKVRAYHDYHLSLGWNGFAYNGASCPHGVAYKGRGKGARTAAQGTDEGNTRSYAWLYIAGGSEPLTNEAKAAFLYGSDAVLERRLRWAHSDWKSTSCPGDPVRAWRDSGWAEPRSTIIRHSEEELMAVNIDGNKMVDDIYAEAGRNGTDQWREHIWPLRIATASDPFAETNVLRKELGLKPWPRG